MKVKRFRIPFDIISFFNVVSELEHHHRNIQELCLPLDVTNKRCWIVSLQGGRGEKGRKGEAGQNGEKVNSLVTNYFFLLV